MAKRNMTKPPEKSKIACQTTPLNFDRFNNHNKINYFSIIILNNIQKPKAKLLFPMVYTLGEELLCQQNDSPKAPASTEPSPMVPYPPRGRKNPREIRSATAAPPAT